MTHTYNISGMMCNNCVAKAKSELLKIGDISEAEIQLEAPQATITMQKHIPVTILQNALNKAGNYTITAADGGMHAIHTSSENKSWFNTYKPVLLIGAYITGATVLLEIVKSGFNIESWMNHFMAAFFLVFSFFKLLDLKGFAESYATYDIIARRWMGWGYVYAFIELLLGLAYLTTFNPLVVNAITFIVMSVSIIGVLQSVLHKRKIQCACLGVVFNVPMSTITIIEDALMIVMSLGMLLALTF
jgi:cation transport ATPase